MGIRITQASFTAGEISPSLYARTDVSKYGLGLATLKNGFVKAQGGISNRAGLEFVCEVKDSTKKTRVAPFAFNTEQTYILEMGDQYLRYIKDGGQIVYPVGDPNEGDTVEDITPYLEADLFDLKYAQSADILTICHKNYEPRELSRNTHYDWDLSTITFAPSVNPPTSNLNGVWTGENVSTYNYKYVITSVDDETGEESEISTAIAVTGEAESDWDVSDYITLSFDAVTGSTEYNVYKNINGIYGFIGSTSEENTGVYSFVDDKIEPDLTRTAPIVKNPFNSVGNYPSVVNYFQQRRIFANTSNKPQNIFASQTGTDKNFNTSKPLIASDAITIKIAEREVNEIRHIVALNDLIVFTSGGEWKCNGENEVFSASPPPKVNLQSSYGCNNVAPIISGSMVLFVQAGASVVRDLGYTYVSNSYDGNELSIFASHLFEGKQIVDWAYSKEPNRIVWAVLSDGTLAALTYNPQHEVMGWSRHETDGEFESVATIREGYEDVPYFVVKRTINGQTKRYIERMKSRIVSDAKDGFFVDSGLIYDGAPVSSVSGLEHLEGKEVIILADGGVITGKTVNSGIVNLDVSASKIIVGLPYEFEMKTLNFEGENTQGAKKIINKISIKVDRSRPDFFIANGDKEFQLERSIESINDAGHLQDGDVEAVPFAEHSSEVQVHLKQKYPLPLTVLSVTPEVNIQNVQN